jgi:hypothetical protein
MVVPSFFVEHDGGLEAFAPFIESYFSRSDLSDVAVAEDAYHRCVGGDRPPVGQLDGGSPGGSGVAP